MSNQEEQLKTLQQQKAVLTEQLAIAELQKQIAASETPAVPLSQLTAGQTKPKESSVTTDDDFGYLSQLVATNVLRQQALAIATKVKEQLAPDDKVLITDALEIAVGELPRIQLTAQLAHHESALAAQLEANAALLQPVTTASAPQYSHADDSVEFGVDDAEVDTTEGDEEAAEMAAEMAPAALPAAAVISAALQAAPIAVGLLADVAGYFQADYTMSGQQFSVANTAVIAPAAGVLGAHSIIADAHFVEDAPLLQTFMALQEQRRLLKTSEALLKTLIMAPLMAEIAALQQALKKAKEADKATIERQIAAKQGALQQAQAAATRTAALVKTFDTFSSAITTGKDGQQALLVQAVLREQLHRRKVTHVLVLNVLSSGGEAITKRTWWRGAQTGYVGGGVLAYLFMMRDGSVIMGDTITTVAEVTASQAWNGAYSSRTINI